MSCVHVPHICRLSNSAEFLWPPQSWSSIGFTYQNISIHQRTYQDVPSIFNPVSISKTACTCVRAYSRRRMRRMGGAHCGHLVCPRPLLGFVSWIPNATRVCPVEWIASCCIWVPQKCSPANSERFKLLELDSSRPRKFTCNHSYTLQSPFHYLLSEPVVIWFPFSSDHSAAVSLGNLPHKSSESRDGVT